MQSQITNMEEPCCQTLVQRNWTTSSHITTTTKARLWNQDQLMSKHTLEKSCGGCPHRSRLCGMWFCLQSLSSEMEGFLMMFEEGWDLAQLQWSVEDGGQLVSTNSLSGGWHTVQDLLPSWASAVWWVMLNNGMD